METTLKKKTEKESNAFSDIDTIDKLKKYLDDDQKRLQHSTYVYHYTSIDTVIKMITSHSWHLCNAANMNDKLEYENGDKERWKDIFFSSFMCEDKESIGMWSMYAQPWERGVKIAIPTPSLRKWIDTIKGIQEISTINLRPTNKIIPVDIDKTTVRLSSVIYCNTDSLQDENTIEQISWSNKKNRNFINASHIPELTGYIKDVAWSYEKEIRIKAQFDNQYGIERVAIPLTDDLIKSMTITASPLFEGDLPDMLKKKIASGVKTDTSIFTYRLNMKTICQSCELKKKYESLNVYDPVN